MPNNFYTAEQAAATSVAMVANEAFLSTMVSRNYEDDLLGGGGKSRTVNVRIPTALVAHARGIDDVTNEIIMDTITEQTRPLTLGTHAYSAVPLSEGDMTLNLENFARQVLSLQTSAVTEFIEAVVADTLLGVPVASEAASIEYDEADPVKTVTAIRRALRKRGVPIAGLNMAVGTDVYAALLDAKAITDVSESGSTDALREGQIGKVRGFTVAESLRVADDEIVAWHSDAVTLATRAPVKPQGAAFGAVVNDNGFSMRYLRDYFSKTTHDRSMVSTFVGAVRHPLYKVTRDTSLIEQGEAGFEAGSASVVEVPNGAFFRASLSDFAAPGA